MVGVGGAAWLCGWGCMAGLGRGFIESIGGTAWYERDHVVYV